MSIILQPPELKEEKKQKQRLTFEDICPLWAAKYKTGDLHTEALLNLYNHDFCMVGEAHKFSCGPHRMSGAPPDTYYNCEACEKASLVIYRAAQVSDYKPSPLLQVEIDDFVNHWNDCHV